MILPNRFFNKYGESRLYMAGSHNTPEFRRAYDALISERARKSQKIS